MVPFGGWEMPVSYPTGTLAEHQACRTAAAVFDVSHLGTVRVRGSGALERLQRTLTNDLTRIEPGRAQYTHLLDPDDASVVDDIIVWWAEPDWFEVIPNASNTAPVLQALGEEGPDVSVADVTDERALLAVQGPEARARLRQIAPEVAEVGRFRVGSFDWRGSRCVVAGTGYTGEDGVECAVPRESAHELWTALLDAGATPAGLGARDTLRLEAGLPLHGHELGPGITPLQAGLGWVVGWDKGEFRGRGALAAEQGRGVSRRLRGIVAEGRRPPREGQKVLVGDEVVGEVTSGNYSPGLGRGIALAFLPPEIDDGAAVEIDVRGTRVAGRVTRPPFVETGG